GAAQRRGRRRQLRHGVPEQRWQRVRHLRRAGHLSVRLHAPRGHDAGRCRRHV
ncbi:MAG: hypothetical protein AVDCRST_MAG33-27, partial [uncultured Thermomicrobiales bacterium]